MVYAGEAPLGSACGVTKRGAERLDWTEAMDRLVHERSDVPLV